MDGNLGRIKIHNSTFNNSRSLGNGGVGVVLDAVLELSQSKFNDNVVERFGGVMRALNYSSVTIDSSSFKHNRVYGDGGTIYIDGNSNVTLKSSTFFDNSAAEHRGVLFLQSIWILIINTTVQNNTAKSGGAIYANTNSNITILNYNTFTYNQATSDYKDIVLNDGGVVLLNRNSIIDINCIVLSCITQPRLGVELFHHLYQITGTGQLLEVAILVLMWLVIMVELFIYSMAAVLKFL